VFSGHKVFAPTGIGVLYGKEALLNETTPWQGGGNMIEDVTFEHTRYKPAPLRFEAGTGNIADAVGLGAAIDYVRKIGMDLMGQYEHQLMAYATRLLREIPGLRIIGTAAETAGVLSFVLTGRKTEDVGAALSRRALRCARAIIARSPSCAAFVSKAPCGRHSRSITIALISMRWLRLSSRSPAALTK
jgi:cysteine desulfurase/selenocysteine lyase